MWLGMEWQKLKQARHRLGSAMGFVFIDKKARGLRLAFAYFWFIRLCKPTRPVGFIIICYNWIKHRQIVETPVSKERIMGTKGLFIVDIEEALSVNKVSSIRTVGGL